MLCPVCANQAPSGVTVCPGCGSDLYRSTSSSAQHSSAQQITRQARRHPRTEHGAEGSATPLISSTSEGADAEPGAGFTAGTILSDRYRIVTLVGRGGLGEVYRADDLKLGQPVALKLLPASLEQDEEVLELLFNEVRTARQVSHPNVGRVHDVGEAEGRHFLTMEYIDGEDLASLLRRIGRLPLGKALELGQQICRGLSEVHRQGLLHRDLKPSNLMIDGAGRARLTDFGLAELADRISGSAISFGTPAYMAPEQRKGEEVTVRSDLYALGLVLYELIGGERTLAPSGSKTLESVSLEPGETAPGEPSVSQLRPLSHVVEGLDPAVEQMILSCLAEDPRDRPASAEQVAAVLLSDERGTGTFLKTIVLCRVEAPQGEAAHDWRRHAQELLLEEEGREIEVLREDSGSLLLVFDRPIGAVRYALSFQRTMKAWEPRIAIHLGETFGGEVPDEVGPSRTSSWAVTGPAGEVLERLAKLALSGQTLLSRGVFDLARQSSGARSEDARWLAHGSYECQGLEDPLEVFEVGLEGESPLTPPPGSEKARRRLVQETIAGWRAAPGLGLPRRPHWILEEKISEGGFGEVWLAAHEKTHERRVFKFCYAPEKLRALQREITLFRLLKETLGDRDDITRILDWSFDEAPYYIESEYTEGGNLSEWADEQGGLEAVPLAMRLEIVAQVAQALAAAHSVGVLHKDVKPQNVLIAEDASGRVRAQLSDFGVGLVVEKEHLFAAGITVQNVTEMTQGGGSVGGTRLYTAPETLEGHPPTVHADIYALGVTLYQVVVGDFSRALASGWERHVEDELLREDIAVAVDGALERRLSSASLLAERLRNLESRRVELAEQRREEEKVEQAMTALARSRRRWRFAGVALVMLLGFAAAMGFMWQRVAHEAEVARQVSDFLVELFEIASPEASLGNTVTAREILDRGADRIEADLVGQPEVQGRLMHTMGVVYRSLGLYDSAAPLFDKALELHQEIYGHDDLRTARVVRAVADIKRLKGHYEQAEELSREALRIHREQLGDRDLEVAESLALVASVLQHQGEYESSEVLFSDVLEIRKERLGDEHLAVAESLSALGYVQGLNQDYEAAERSHQEALATQLKLLPEDHPALVKQMSMLAYLLYLKYDYDKAETLFRSSLESQERVLGASHPGLIVNLNLLSLILQDRGDYEEAEKLIQKSIEINRESRGSNHPFYAGSLGYLADLKQKSGEYHQAIQLFHEALEILKSALGDGHPDVGAGLSRLAVSYYQAGQHEEALAFLREAVDIQRKSDYQGRNAVRHLHYEGLILEAGGDDQAAVRKLHEAAELAEQVFGGDDPGVANVLVSLARVLARVGDFEEAEGIATKAVSLLRASRLPGGHWRINYAESVLGLCLSAAGRYSEAEAILGRTYSSLRENRGAPAFFRQSARQHLSMLYGNWGKELPADGLLDPVRQ